MAPAWRTLSACRVGTLADIASRRHSWRRPWRGSSSLCARRTSPPDLLPWTECNPNSPGFPPQARKFLGDLERHNTREWFTPRKPIYEDKVKGPMSELVLSLGEAMREFAPELNSDPKKAIYRIYRDVRFSKDKSPYKTWIAAVFSPRGLPKHAGAGAYFHISPDEILVGGGGLRAGPGRVAGYSESHREPRRRVPGAVEGTRLPAMFWRNDGRDSEAGAEGFCEGPSGGGSAGPQAIPGNESVAA